MPAISSPDSTGRQRIDRLAVAVLAQDGLLGVAVGVADAQAHQEAVELAFRQRIGALELVGVLRGQHEERRAQRPRLAVQRHLAVAHRLQQGALGARRGPVDLVGQDDLGEERAGLEDELRRWAGGRRWCRAGRWAAGRA